MPDQPQVQAQSAYFNLHVEGVGYLNRVRTVKPKRGQEFMACTVSAMRGSTADLGYTKFDCIVSGADAQKVVGYFVCKIRESGGFHFLLAFQSLG